jgi:dTDP-4-amino-4,6-dideoxygalactose transaminase
MDPIMDIARQKHLGVIEDSCQTMFVQYKGGSVGSFGDLACFSTYVAHLLVTGVGGIILTQDEELSLLCRSYINHGRDAIYLNIDDDDLARGTDRFFEIVNKRFSFVRMGYSYRVTEMEGALGLAAFEERGSMLESRLKNALYLINGLKDLGSYLQLPSWPQYSGHAFMLFPLVVRPPVKRDELLFFLESRGIETRMLMPLLNQPFYLKLFGDLEKDYPVASALSRRGFYIGCHQGLDQEDLDYIVEQFHDFFRRI